RLAAPRALAIRPGSDIQAILQGGPQRAIVLRRYEKNSVRSPYPGTKFRPGSWRTLVAILVVDRQLCDLDDAELQLCGRQLRECVRHLSIDRISPQASHDHGYVAYLVHIVPFSGLWAKMHLWSTKSTLTSGGQLEFRRHLIEE